MHIPIDDVIEDFIKMLPFKKSWVAIGPEFADIHDKSTRSIFHLTETTSSCMPFHLYGGKSGAPKVKWQQATNFYSSPLEWQFLAYGAGRPIFNLSYPDQVNIYALLMLKEIHPVLLKKFDTLHQNNLALIAADEEKKLEIEKERLRIEAQQRKEKAEADRIWRETELRIKAEREEREAAANRRSFRFFIIFILIVSGVVFLYYWNESEERKKLEEKERQRKLDEQKNLEEKKERKKANKNFRASVTRFKNWKKKRSTLKSQINQIKKRQSKAEKDALDLQKELKILNPKKKKLDDHIAQLTKDIQDEKKVVKILREKYPFIDAYLDNR